MEAVVAASVAVDGAMVVVVVMAVAATVWFPVQSRCRPPKGRFCTSTKVLRSTFQGSMVTLSMLTADELTSAVELPAVTAVSVNVGFVPASTVVVILERIVSWV